MSSKLKTSVAAIALAAMLGSGFGAFAQTATEAPAAEAPAATATEAPATAQTVLPEILRNPVFTNVTTEAARRGNMTLVTATLEDGTELRGVIDAEGNLAGLRAPQGTALPQVVIDALIPQTLRGNAVLGEIAVISAVGTRDGAVMVGGQDATGQQVRAGFDAQGALMRFGRHDGERRGPAFHGERGDRGERGNRGEPRRERGDRGPRERGAESRPAIDAAAIRQTLEAAGYTQIDDIEASRRGIKAEAVNPQGQRVEITLNPRGEIIRERLDD